MLQEGRNNKATTKESADSGRLRPGSESSDQCFR